MRPRQHVPTAFRLFRHLIQMHLDPESCWNWLGVVTQDGNPLWKFNETSTTATRLLWHYVFKEPFKKRLVICASCENKLCMRPSHLYRDDVRSVTLAHGRQTNIIPAVCKKITREQANEIRFSREPIKKLMAKYGLSYSGVYAIKSRRYWK